jgi:formylglycine-generating enzyme required for sulfatase activity
MAETKSIQIFLCHASEDKPAVETIYERLKGLGYKPWLDKKDLLPGQRWRSEIPKVIRASDYILIFLSKTSVAKRGYVQNEFKLALDVLREVPEGTIYAIPIRLDDCAIPEQFSDLQWCNLFEPDGFEYLLPALQAGRPSPELVVAAPQSTSMGHAIPVQPMNDVARQPFEPEISLIPAGEFLMGSDPQKDPDAEPEEQPQHTLHLPDYYLAKTPVTNLQYMTFVQAIASGKSTSSANSGQSANGIIVGFGPYSTNRELPRGKEDHPVARISWNDAVAYCRWLSETTGKSYGLPSEAEWEKGARGTDGYIYPWGNQWDATRCRIGGGTTSVNAYPEGASPYGLLDMVGNVWEWTRSLWGENLDVANYSYSYDSEDGRENLNASDVTWRVLRGGAFLNSPRRMRCAYRHRRDPNRRFRHIGFRVVMYP